MSGRVASLLELGAGFHLDFTGRANIYMNGIMMGYSRREMESKIDEIVDFAELARTSTSPCARTHREWVCALVSASPSPSIPTF